MAISSLSKCKHSNLFTLHDILSEHLTMKHQIVYDKHAAFIAHWKLLRLLFRLMASFAWSRAFVCDINSRGNSKNTWEQFEAQR